MGTLESETKTLLWVMRFKTPPWSIKIQPESSSSACTDGGTSSPDTTLGSRVRQTLQQKSRWRPGTSCVVSALIPAIRVQRATRPSHLDSWTPSLWDDRSCSCLREQLLHLRLWTDAPKTASYSRKLLTHEPGGGSNLWPVSSVRSSQCQTTPPCLTWILVSQNWS